MRQRLEESSVKQYLRTVLLDEFDTRFLASSGQVSMFTLPSDSLEFERKACRLYGQSYVSFTAVERDAKIYSRALAKSEELALPMDLHHMEDTTYWERVKDGKKFDFVWLDFCGPWSGKSESSIRSILETDRLQFGQQNPLLAITLLAARESEGRPKLPSNEILSTLTTFSQEEIILKERLYGTPVRMNEIAHERGFHFNTLKVVKYRDKVRGNRASPMLLFLFEVLNRIPRGRKKVGHPVISISQELH